MRTTLNINDDLLHDAAKLTGIKDKTALVMLGLKSLIAKESARRLAQLGGTQKSLRHNAFKSALDKVNRKHAQTLKALA